MATLGELQKRSAKEWLMINVMDPNFTKQIQELHVLDGRISTLRERCLNIVNGDPEMGTHAETVTPYPIPKR